MAEEIHLIRGGQILIDGVRRYKGMQIVRIEQEARGVRGW